jgi:hypothetical protein
VAKADEPTVCYILTFEKMREVLGKNMNNIIYYNLEKWALKRSGCFDEIS